MRLPTLPEVEDGRIQGPSNEPVGFFVLRRGNAMLRVQASNGCGWDHVSVSLPTRCPTWEEMCWIKDKFFLPEEPAMQLHPPKSDYRSYHDFCLHIWRPQQTKDMANLRESWGDEWDDRWESPGRIPLPPGHFVAPESSIKATQ